ncbi:S66 peptidase family protein [Saliphagus sp. GCM10025317]
MDDQEFVTPPPLERGSQIAVVAPASNPALEAPHVYELGLERLRTVFDLKPVEYPTTEMGREELYENPKARARDVMDAFADPDVDGVIAVIGGNDQIRMLSHLEPDVLRENPTRFYGYSDNTNLATYLWNLGIVSFYGPAVMVELAMDGEMFDHTVAYAERAFFEDSIGTLEPAQRFTDQPGNWADPEALETPRDTEPSPGWHWSGGTDAVSGRVWGGCLEIIDQQFLADRYLPEDDALEGTVLALETSEEVPVPEWVAGVLRALGERGLLERFAGVLVGRPASRSHEEDRPPEWRETYREQQREVVADVLAEYNPDAPVVQGLEFGHAWPTVPISIGGRVEIDPAEETVRFP